jgi:hypothetical protein
LPIIYHFLYRSNPFDLTMTAGIYLATVAEILMAIVMVIVMTIAIIIAAIAIAIGMDLSPYACDSGLEALVGLARWVYSL